jgi:predicted TIM-barrel fold metal-dependent hydrolase
MKGVRVLIDAHTHYLPSTLIDVLERRDAPPRITRGDRGKVLEYGRGYAERILPQMGDADQMLDVMDQDGIAMGVVSINQPGVIGLPVPDAIAVAREMNDELGDLARRSSGRVVGLGALPMQTPRQAAAELERIMSQGFVGAIVCSNVAGRYLDEAEYDVVFAAADALGATVFVHPILPVAASAFRDTSLLTTLGFLVDTTTAVVQLVANGIYDRHPNLKLYLGHAGSLIPQIIGRLDAEVERRSDGRARLENAPSEYLKRIYTDTVSGWAPALRSAIELVGPGNVMHGTDYPFWERSRSRQVMDEVGADPDVLRMMAYENADRLFGLDVRRDAQPSGGTASPIS